MNLSWINKFNGIAVLEGATGNCYPATSIQLEQKIEMCISQKVKSSLFGLQKYFYVITFLILWYCPEKNPHNFSFYMFFKYLLINFYFIIWIRIRKSNLMAISNLFDLFHLDLFITQCWRCSKKLISLTTRNNEQWKIKFKMNCQK